MKKPIYFRQLNHIEVLVHHVGPGEKFEVRFRKRSKTGRMVSVFEPYDMAIVSFLASDVRHMFTDIGLGDLRSTITDELRETVVTPVKKNLA